MPETSKSKPSRGGGGKGKGTPNTSKHTSAPGSPVPWVVAVLTAVVAVLAWVLLNDPNPSCRVKVWLNRWSLSSVHKPKPEYNTAEYNSTMLWGSYRPHLYHGMRTRTNKGVLTGAMWLGPRVPPRHTAEDGDAVMFRWEKHDGQLFGHQTVQDNHLGIQMDTYMVKKPYGTRGGNWAVRFTGRAKQKFEFIYYVVVEGGGKPLQFVDLSGQSALLSGNSTPIGNFSVVLNNKLEPNGTWHVLGKKQKEDAWNLVSGKQPKPLEVNGSRANVVFFTTVVEGGNFQIDVSLINHENPSGTGNDIQIHSLTDIQPYLHQNEFLGCDFDLLLEQHQQAFEAQFEATFGLQEKGYHVGEIDMAKSALSNYLGGIGYWYGGHKQYASPPPPDRPRWPPAVDILDMPPAPLFSGVPSRAKFPRGFLWDEGFHQLLAARWNTEISKDVILHWLKLGDENGYIAREQIRGAEPRTRVPEEFVPQNPMAANPPTMTLQIQNFARDNQDGKHTKFLKEVWPFLEKWYRWFKRTQAAGDVGEYRWKGREGFHCLPSGLDDHPRSKCLTEKERNVDLYSWIGLLSSTMVDIATAVNAPSEDYVVAHQEIIQNLPRIHWDETLQQFSDVSGCKQPPHQQQPDEKKKKKKKKPNTNDSNEPTEPTHLPWFGYVNLFPLLTGIINNDTQAKAVIQQASGDLMSGFGLRSLRQKDVMQPNFPQHEKYWTGPIWININYMFLRTLKQNYGYIPNSKEVYEQLRSDLVRNIYSNFQATGKLWENYNPDEGNQDPQQGSVEKPGRGQGTAPFTGWTTLVVLMMAEQY